MTVKVHGHMADGTYNAYKANHDGYVIINYEYRTWPVTLERIREFDLPKHLIGKEGWWVPGEHVTELTEPIKGIYE